MKKSLSIYKLFVLMCFLCSCVTESHKTLPAQKVSSYNVPYAGERLRVAVGKFDNKSNYMNGIFSDGIDRIGNQARSILVTHLHQTNRFNVLERENMQEITAEAAMANKNQSLKGANYIITGSIADFGRKEVGDKQLFGIIGSGKSQIAYARINLNVVNVLTSEVVYTTQGLGEYSLENREIIGFGGTSGYDSTLNSKVLDLAMREAINTMIVDLQQKPW